MLKPRRGRPLVYKVDAQCHSAQMLYSQCNTALNPDLYILFGTAPFFFESSKETSASQTAHSMICDLCRHWKRSRKIRFTMVADRCSLDTQMDELATWLAALETKRKRERRAHPGHEHDDSTTVGDSRSVRWNADITA